MSTRPEVVLVRPSKPSTRAQGKRTIWPGMKTPSVRRPNKISEPVNRHFDKTYPFMEPMAVEMMVAGTTMATELKKKGSIPEQVPPTQNLSQADDQYSSEKLCGRPIRPFRLMSGRSRKELRTTTASG